MVVMDISTHELSREHLSLQGMESELGEARYFQPRAFCLEVFSFLLNPPSYFYSSQFLSRWWKE